MFSINLGYPFNDIIKSGDHKWRYIIVEPFILNKYYICIKIIISDTGTHGRGDSDLLVQSLYE